MGMGTDMHMGDGTKDTTMTRRTTSRPEPEVVTLESVRGRRAAALPLCARDAGENSLARAVKIETVRPDGARQLFTMADRGGYLESIEEIPEPHAFTAHADHRRRNPRRRFRRTRTCARRDGAATTTCAPPSST